MKDLFGLGVAVGQNQTLGVIAARCTAAQAETLARLRKEKLYKRVSEHWRDFCPEYLNMSGAQADRIVHLYGEFGPTYFELAQLTRVSAETYRVIAPAITNGVLTLDGEEIALTLENSRRVAVAVAKARRTRTPPAISGDEHLARLTQRYNTLSDEFNSIPLESRTAFEEFGAAMGQLCTALNTIRQQFGL
jgi:hypothetical protein